MLTISYSANHGAIAEFRQEAAIDFAVWALLYDGLTAAPFSIHHRGPGNLSAAGLDEESWSSWFRHLVLAHHTGLRLRREGSSPLLKQWETGLSYVSMVFDGRPNAITAHNPDALPILEKVYDKVLELTSCSTDVTALDTSVAKSPSAFWRGPENVREELTKLWQPYRVDAAQRVYHASDLHRAMSRDEHFAAEVDITIRKALCKEERFLMFHFVNYPEKVIYPIASSVVIGLPKSFLVKENIKPVLVEAVEVARTTF